MSESRVTVLSEPMLEFRYGQQLSDPHAGLSLFGPYDADRPGKPKQINYAVVGTHQGAKAFGLFADAIGKPIYPSWYDRAKTLKKNPYLWPPFPGFEAAFECAWASQASWTGIVDESKLNKSLQYQDTFRRVYEVVNLYLEAIRIASQRDDHCDLIICVVPETVWQLCRPQSRVADGIGGMPGAKSRIARLHHEDFFDDYVPEQYELAPDFRRQLKARVMETGIPVQLVRESTLRINEPENKKSKERILTELSDRAWNLSTAIYYKAGGKPWRLAAAREGVCYVGLAFRRAPLETSAPSNTACCAAQMFLDTGDGVVFRGQFGPWYSEETNQYHLTREGAKNLLSGTLRAYYEQKGKTLKEIFLHSRSLIEDAEWNGYKDACPSDVKIVGIRVRGESNGFQLYRDGDWILQRGTYWEVNEKTAYLWANGFKDGILTYDGTELPVPLRIDIQHGNSNIRQVAQDILALTKLNYNECKYGDSAPVTIGFSNKVGEILVSNPTVHGAKPNFKFYI